MDYEITIGSKTRKLAITPETPDGKKFFIAFSGKRSEIEILNQDTDEMVASIHNKVYGVKVLKASFAGVIFVANGKIIEARLKRNEITSQDYSGPTSLGGEIRSNFPAKIIKINARVGDSLHKGDTFIVLEAMKMEAQVKVTGECVVKEILVKEGEMVERGKTLARIEMR
jgi:biotin carboxyl carrier protein